MPKFRQSFLLLRFVVFDLGVVEHNNDKIEHEVVTLGKRVLQLEQDDVRAENKRLRTKLESADISVTFAHMKKDRVERDLYQLWLSAYRFSGNMIRQRVVEERPSEVIDVLAPFGETQPSEPQGSPHDMQ